MSDSASFQAPVVPDDEYNQTLLAHVRPKDWSGPKVSGRYNLVVIGAGTAGLVTAAGAAGLGARVALIEKNLMGGDCLNVGCVPSKAIIRAGRAAAEVREAAAFGVQVDGSHVDFAAVMARMRRLRAQISANDSAQRFKELGIDVFLGEAHFSSPKTVEVDGTTLQFKKAVIATGARAAIPPIEGLNELGCLTNETVFSLTERPERLLVLGGGPIGCELAQTFQRLGSQVTLVEMMPRLIPRDDPEASEILTKSLERDGVKILLGTMGKQVKRTGDGKELVVAIDGAIDGTAQSLVADEILVGAGRRPNVEGLNLETAGVAYDPRKGVLVNDQLQTSNRRIYAAGDICLKYQFTHTADATARIVIQNALFLGRKKLSALTIPWCTYTAPEIAHVGLYETDATERGIATTTYKVPFNDVDRAILEGDEAGFVKILVKQGGDEILGATIVARHAGEMISEISVAMAGKLGLGSLASVIHPYPTQAEAIRKAGDAYNRTRLTPFVQKLFKRWLSWTR